MPKGSGVTWKVCPRSPDNSSGRCPSPRSTTSAASARRSRSRRNRPATTRARPSARSRKSTISSACSTPASATATAPSAASRSPPKRASRSSPASWRLKPARSTPCSPPSSAAKKASTRTCSKTCASKASCAASTANTFRSTTISRSIARCGTTSRSSSTAQSSAERPRPTRRSRRYRPRHRQRQHHHRRPQRPKMATRTKTPSKPSAAATPPELEVTEEDDRPAQQSTESPRRRHPTRRHRSLLPLRLHRLRHQLRRTNAAALQLQQPAAACASRATASASFQLRCRPTRPRQHEVSFEQGCIELVGSWERSRRWKRHIYRGVAETMERKLGLDEGTLLEKPWKELTQKATRHLALGHRRRAHHVHLARQSGPKIRRHVRRPHPRAAGKIRTPAKARSRFASSNST